MAGVATIAGGVVMVLTYLANVNVNIIDSIIIDYNFYLYCYHLYIYRHN